ncbi:hypothetical protein AB0K09_30405, partial [Streptomyces sp. NPDC049577]|uniref:hypothetical protein n=1 Tax=Streptomyces sp. NPDC049577 TaxID=3155153 RepID=UPI00342E9DA6
MLESIEPIEPAGAHSAAGNNADNSPSDTLPPRRRRRVASRPAGSPAAEAPNPGDDAPAAESPEAAASAETKPTRRRATRKTAADQLARVEEQMAELRRRKEALRGVTEAME